MTENDSHDFAARFHARFRRVLEFIDAHIDEPLPLERLSEVAAFSKFHFQRQFTELYTMGVYQYVQLLRLNRAAHRLAYREQLSIMRIAQDAGYDGAESFARAFRRKLGQSPSEFREAPDWNSWQSIKNPLHQLRSEHMALSHTAEDVSIVEFTTTRVAALEHRGAPDRLGDSIRKFIDWRKQNRLSPRVSATFNIAYDDPELTEAAQFRFDICAATDEEVAPNSHGIISKVIPGGRCAKLRHVGSEATLGHAIRYLYARWLPASGEEPRDYPLFMQRVLFFPDVAEHEAVTDLFLPLK
ncbi:MAG: GyrI-like domain-containing protein [Povalibacter sp.]